MSTRFRSGDKKRHFRKFSHTFPPLFRQHMGGKSESRTVTSRLTVNVSRHMRTVGRNKSPFLGAFPKLQMRLFRPSLRMEQLVSHWTDFHDL